MPDYHQLSNFIWQIADLLRGPYRRVLDSQEIETERPPLSAVSGGVTGWE